ncbi:unnamed protein product [Phytophthora fragariaefolia]|uniref:Unnamed protein product n=1 Tax=Phytophthora fragariaefolia TaxID=1490495 RepID=A0A9W6XPJ9_9STRA|nr:unnamed protein product [Phytophthora fragariaefolia]
MQATQRRCEVRRLSSSTQSSQISHKVLSKLHNLRWSGAQQAYTTKFLHLISQLDCELPEVVKRWFYQQNLRPETSAFVSQNVPSTLQEVIELAQRFEDARAATPGSNAKKEQGEQKPPGKNAALKKNSGGQNSTQQKPSYGTKSGDKLTCSYCDKTGHSEANCFKKKAAASGQLHYQDEDAVPPTRRNKIYGYLCQGGRVVDASVSIFVNSGASFNAIAPEVAANLKLKVTTLQGPLRVKLGGGQRVGIPRRTTTITVSMEGFPEYATEVFVMEIPEGKNVLLGFTWLEDVNPDIDWAHDYVSSVGETKVISHRQFRRMHHDKDAFCFAVRICEDTSDKAARQLSQGWEQLRGRPEEAVVVKYKNTVFRAELPSVTPQRSVDVEAEVELSDDTPVARKQFRLSDEMKEAIRAWTLEMLEAGIIRPSKSPYCAPTFCVKKAVGWRIVHDFRGINSKRLRLREKDIQYTAFSTPDGQYEYLVTPMGLACSPSAFNRMMQQVFSDQRSFCRAYFDDLFVFTKTTSLEDHLEALDKVLKRCEEQQLYIKLEKCTFCASEIPCLGDFFGRDGVQMDPDKCRVIREWPLPRTRRQLQSFIGTCVYSILEQKTCSQRLARWLNELGSYRPLFRWIPGTSNVVTDAISRNPAFEPAESAQHVSLASLLQQLTSQHDEPTADETYSHYMAARPSIAQQCIRLYPQDSTYGLLDAHLSTRIDPSTPPPVEVPRQLRANLRHFVIEDGLLYYQPNADLPRRLCVPDDVDLRNAILFEHHDSATSGHSGYLKTLMALQERFYWPRMDRAARRYVASCKMCQRIKVSQRKAAGLLHPLEVPTNRWRHITMDFVTGLPCGRRSTRDAIMVVVDRLTKRAHFILATTTCTAKEAARLFCDHYQRLHGLPLSIVSDRDFKVTSKFRSELMSFRRTQLQLSAAFRPETDGQTEKTNHFVADYLRAFVNACHDDWDEMLSLAVFAYNARVHSSIGMAPFTAELGYIPRSAADLASPSLRGRRPYAVKFVEHQKVLLQQCKDMLEKSQATMKYFHDRNRPTYQFAEGDQVLLDTSNLDLHHLGTTGKRKLAPRFIGPYPVVKPTTPDTYQLGLPPGLRLHDEFHVSYLRPYVFDSNPRRLNNVPQLITREGYEGLQVQAILQRRVRKGKVEFKVRWYGRDNKDSWEPEDNLEQAGGLIERFHLTQPHRSTRQRSM